MKNDKLCWYCRNFYVRQAYLEYSDAYPAEDFEIKCLEGVWEFDPYDINETQFRELIETAEKCPLFKFDEKCLK